MNSCLKEQPGRERKQILVQEVLQTRDWVKAGSFHWVHVLQLSKPILLASYCTAEMEEAAVWSIHEPAWKSMWAAQTWNRCGRLDEARAGEGKEGCSEGARAEEFTEVCQSGTLSSWAGPRGGVEVGPLWEGKQKGEAASCSSTEVYGEFDRQGAERLDRRRV